MRALGRMWVEAFLAGGPANPVDQRLLGTRAFRPLEMATDMAALAFKVLRITFSSVGWIRETIVESSRALRIVTTPLLVTTVIFLVAFASVLLGELVFQLGAGDRLGGGVYVGVVRELSAYLTFFVLAAVVGSSIAGDLGARRVREELDALDVLGVDKFKMLIVPRVVATTLAAPVLGFLVVLVGGVAVLLADTVTIDQPLRPQIESVFLIMNWYDVVAALLKATLVGFFIGIVACQKGLSARGGAEGVGRAVGESVVIMFVGIYVIHTLFAIAFQTLVPESIDLKG